MRTNRGIVIGVLCEGALVDEYIHRNEDEYTVSCFIPGEPNNTFEIFVSNDLVMQDVSISIRIDGTFIGRYYLGPGQNVLPGLYISECVTKPFRFRQLAIPASDEPTLRDPSQFKWESIGLLEFSVYRRHEERPTPSISTGPERPIPPIEGVQGVTLDPPDEPYARMIFRYRPRAVLQAQGVIPSRSQPTLSAPPSPPPNPPPPTTQWNTNSVNSAQHSTPSSPLAGRQTDQPARTRRFAASADPAPSRQRYSPYTLPANEARVPSRAHSMPEPASTAPPLLPPIIAPPTQANDNTSEELVLIKDQLAHVYDQMQRAMRQMHGCIETVDGSMRQIRYLQRQVDVIEHRQQQMQQTQQTQQTSPPQPQRNRPSSVKSEPLTPNAAGQRQPIVVSPGPTPRRSPLLQWPE